jgi:hypothetical protein
MTQSSGQPPTPTCERRRRRSGNKKNLQHRDMVKCTACTQHYDSVRRVYDIDLNPSTAIRIAMQYYPAAAATLYKYNRVTQKKE